MSIYLGRAIDYIDSVPNLWPCGVAIRSIASYLELSHQPFNISLCMCSYQHRL